MPNSIGFEKQVWKNLMMNTAGQDHPGHQSSTESTLTTLTETNAISCLVQSKTCGLAMLVERLLSEARNNTYTKHLISTLINRLHYNSINIKSSTEEEVKKFIANMLNIAAHFARSSGPHLTSSGKAANLLTSAIQKFDRQLVDAETLEYEWKEFLFHFYRFRLKDWSAT